MHIFEPGTQVDLMRSGEWEGPFVVTDRVGRTPEHLVLRNPENGVLFEEHVDEHSVGYQIRRAEKQDPAEAIVELLRPDPWGQALAKDLRRFADDGEYPGDDERD